MTPAAKRVMEQVRQSDHVTYERWVQAIVDNALELAAERLANEWPGPAAQIVRELKSEQL